MFFALSWDERRLNPAARRILPIAVAMQHTFENRVMIREPRELAWLRHQVAEGSADWSAIRAWFLAHCEPRRPWPAPAS